MAGALVASGATLSLAVHPWFGLVPLLIGSGLLFSAVTDTCTLGLLLSWLPYNRPASCDVAGMVAALKTGLAPVSANPRTNAPGGDASCAS